MELDSYSVESKTDDEILDEPTIQSDESAFAPLLSEFLRVGDRKVHGWESPMQGAQTN